MRISIKFMSLLALVLLNLACNKESSDPVTEFRVNAISPQSGPVGTEINISGSGFPDNPEDIELSVGGVPAAILDLTRENIRTQVPEGADSGDIRVVVNGIVQVAPSTFTVLEELESERIENLFAPQAGGQGQGEIGGEFTKFSFESGAQTESETEWDIAFRGTTIAVNGGMATGTNDEPMRNGRAGAAIVSGTFDEISTADGLAFMQDAEGAFAIPTGSDNGWYNYNFMTNLVTPIPGVVLVFRTHDGKFAKVEILSYYENAPENPDGSSDASRYYTFKYVFNPNEGETNLVD